LILLGIGCIIGAGIVGKSLGKLSRGRQLCSIIPWQQRSSNATLPSPLAVLTGVAANKYAGPGVVLSYGAHILKLCPIISYHIRRYMPTDCLSFCTDTPLVVAAIPILITNLPAPPAVFATVAAMLTAFCYAEYASEVSVAGEAFNWVGGGCLLVRVLPRSYDQIVNDGMHTVGAQVLLPARN
jgi:hypothetical protein